MLDEESVLRAMAKYGPSALRTRWPCTGASRRRASIARSSSQDEIDYPTKPAEHVVVVSELKRLRMDFVSFALRWAASRRVWSTSAISGELKRDFEIHAALARALGPYKLSLHSGSDKYSTYPLIAEATKGVVHLKTAGTSWARPCA